MTIVAAEAAPSAVAEAEGAVAGRGAAAAASAPSRRRPPERRRRPGTHSPGRPRAAAAQPPPTRKSGQGRAFAEGYAADAATKARNHGKKSLTFTAGKGDYHKVVAAEFLFAVAVISIAPLVTPGAGSASTGPSPYGRQDITRLAGVFTLFFILALVSHGRPGKMAVTFGLLVDLGVLFRASQRGVLKGAAAAFGGKSSSSSSGGGTVAT